MSASGQLGSAGFACAMENRFMSLPVPTRMCSTRPSASLTTGMRIVMLGFEFALKAVNRKTDAEGMTLDDVLDDIRRVLARAAASTVLALAENLPKIIDASAVNHEDVE
jgi:hypothetical protein